MLQIKRQNGDYLTLSNYKVQNVLQSLGGRIFSCEFIKKDGSLRKMVARFGVTKHLKGGVNKVERKSNDYVTVYDVQSMGYRVINLSTIKRLKANGITYKIA